MRRSQLFSIVWSSRPNQETSGQSVRPQPRAAALHIPRCSPRLRVSVVSSLVFLILLTLSQPLPVAAQTPTPQLSADLSHAPGWVVISVDEYQNLRAHAFPT